MIPEHVWIAVEWTLSNVQWSINERAEFLRKIGEVAAT